MSRLSIEITAEQHQRLKAMAALSGRTIKEYILSRVLPPAPAADFMTPEEALRQLEDFLELRIQEAECGAVISQSVEQIFEEVRDRLKQ